MNPAIDTCLRAPTAGAAAQPAWPSGGHAGAPVPRVRPTAAAQALLGGFDADRVGWAFASGYQAALRALLPDLPADAVAAFCVTEESGNRPRDIHTRFTPQADGSVSISGAKRWTTLGPDSNVLLIVGALPPTEDDGTRAAEGGARAGWRARPAAAADARDALRARGATRAGAARRRQGRCRRAAARRRLRALRQALPHDRGRARHAGGAGLPAARDPRARLAIGLCRTAVRDDGRRWPTWPTRRPTRRPRTWCWPARWPTPTPCMPKPARCGRRPATTRRRSAGSGTRRSSAWPDRRAASARHAPGSACRAAGA